MTDTRTEIHAPLLVDPSTKQNVTDLLLDRVTRSPGHVAFKVALRDSTAGALADVTTAEFHRTVTSVAKGLIRKGVRPGDAIAIQGPTSYEWAVADMASFWVGAVVVPIFDTASPDQVDFALKDAGVKWGFATTAKQRAGIQDSLVKPSSSSAEVVWSLSLDDSGMLGLAESGLGISDETLEERRVSAALDDVATIVYTSGTEGRPKGVVITHRNLVGQVLNIAAGYREVFSVDGSTLIFLPLAHVLARGLQLICLSEGMAISYESDPSKAVAALAQIRPSFLVVVPRVLQKVRERVAATAAQKRIGWLWKNAETTAVSFGLHLERVQDAPHTKPPLQLRAAHTFFDLLFYRKVRKLFGNKLEFVLSGAAPLEKELGLLFRGMGIDVYEGYGLTETTAPVTGNRVGNNFSGTVGPPQPGHSIRISNEGEVLARGIGVTPGYWNAPSTDNSFVDGYFKTGDLGRLDSQGRLTITGRIKEAIVTAGGKTISPQAWEQQVESDPLIAHAIMVGEAKPFPGAFVFLESSELSRVGLELEASEQGFTPVEEPKILARVIRALQTANQQVSKPEQVKRFAVFVTRFQPGSEFMTPTMKLRRSNVLGKMTRQFEELYVSGRALQ
ncbi:AMP-dependent synthetase/ligase [Timonella senegalensis]|uniref:AMP-dependent synthetase/ligase n=1 Tax=Timonella senegalensis TaxID=1465825 RepID=UPI002FDED35F